jgi:Protein of unknown function (DUF3667)
MTDELAGAGDIITGAVIARAIETDAGEQTGDSLEIICLNCGTHLSGPFCAACGQKAHVHRTLVGFGHDFLHGVFHFDGKIWRTLPMLFWHPGDLTRRYIHGERAKFVSPLALFLFTVFLTFATFSEITPAQINSKTAQSATISQKKISAGIVEKIDEKAKSQATLNRNQPPSLDWHFADLEIPRLGKLNDIVKHAAENPQLLIYKIQSNAYKYSWALIPLSVPFVWLLFFWQRRFKMFDHTVFVTYSLSFMLLLSAVCALCIQFAATQVIGGLLLSLAPPIHMYRQLHQAYKTTRFGAFWRMCALTVFAVTALGLFIMLIIALGVTG